MYELINIDRHGKTHVIDEGLTLKEATRLKYNNSIIFTDETFEIRKQ